MQIFGLEEMMMKKSYRMIAAAAAFLMLACATAACTASGGSPSPVPSGNIASPSPATGYTAGEKPYSDLKAEDVERIRMVVYSDAQPPDWPDPFKDAVSPQDLQALVDIIDGVEIKAETDYMHMPIGATGYALDINMKDGTLMRVYLYGDHNLTAPGRIYETATLPDLSAAFKALSGRERLLPNTSDTPELENSSLFELDGWHYYFEPNDRNYCMPGYLVRESGQGDIEVVDRYVDLIHPSIRVEGGRIMFRGYATEKDANLDASAFFNILPDGSDRKPGD
jgi:hypothetical protein